MKLSTTDSLLASELYLSGMTLEEVRLKLDTSLLYLKRALKEHGVQTRSTGYTKYNYNKNYFTNIDSEEKAYFLGFIFADGCVCLAQNNYLLRINIHSDDRAILDRFLISIEGNMPVTKQKNRNSVDIRVYGKQIVSDLIKLGCTERKSLTLQFPNLPNTQIHHFMRGYFDGDGCVKYARQGKTGIFEIYSSFDFCQQYAEVMHKNCGLNIPKLYRKTNHGSMSWSGRGNISKAYNFLYKDATVYLERKHDRMESLIYKPGEKGYGE